MSPTIPFLAPARRLVPRPPRSRSTLARLALAAALASLAACSDGTTAPDAQPPDLDGPSAFDLVDSALARGQIDAETALLQKVYAALGDARLDERFHDPLLAQRIRIPDPLPALLRTAAGRLPSLSPAAQRALAPYFQPPRYVGSAWTGRAAAAGARASRTGALPGPVPGPGPLPKEGWSHVDAPGIPVRVWTHPEYSRGHITAGRVITELEAKAWPQLTALMRRTPVSDEGIHAFTGTDGEEYAWGDGGDGRFDIYLMKPNLLGMRSHAVTVAYPPGCGERPGFMLLSADLNEEYWPLGPSLAHEFFHALQFAFAREVSCEEEWDESTAQWASYYVYPRWNPEPEDYLLAQPDSPLYGTIGYWKWLFNAYLQHAHTPDLVRATYEQYASAPTAMDALDAALPGGMKRHWPEFAVHAWNAAPGEASFVGWEGVDTRPSAKYLEERTVIVKLDGGARAEGKIAAPPQAITRKYNPLHVADERVRWLEIENPYANRSRPKIALQAWVKVRGAEWKLEDWSGRSRVTFCRSRAAERVDSLVIILADYTLDGSDGDRPHLPWEARDQCPDAYAIAVREWATSEEYGTTYDVSYSARIATPPDGASGLVGAGTYEGTIITHKANCHNGAPDESETFRVEGRLDASGGAEGPDGWFSYVLATLDWKFMPFLGRMAQTAEELEATRGLGTVGSALKPLRLQGGHAERTDTLSRSWSDCTGQAYRIRTTTVRRSGGA